MFGIRLTPTAPICIGKATLWTLDAILHGILYDEARRSARDPDNTFLRDSLPLDRHRGVFAASAARFIDPVRSPMTKVGGLRPVQDMHDIRPYSSDRGPSARLPRIRTTQGQHKAHLTRYTLITAAHVEWLFSGDPDRVKDILLRTDALGGCKKDGFGTFDPASIRIEKIDREWSFTDPATGHLLRQVPVRLADTPTGSAMVETMTWFPPYWNAADAEPCYTPAISG